MSTSSHIGAKRPRQHHDEVLALPAESSIQTPTCPLDMLSFVAPAAPDMIWECNATVFRTYVEYLEGASRQLSRRKSTTLTASATIQKPETGSDVER